jgi:hypothetical protein
MAFKAQRRAEERAALPDVPKTLTAREHALAHAYALTEWQGKPNASEAARQAGYQAGPSLRGTASQALARPHVQAELSRAREQLIAEQRLNLAWWRGGVILAHQRAVNSGDLANEIRTLEVAGKHLGAFDNANDGNDTAASVLAALSVLGARMNAARTLPEPAKVTVEARVMGVLRSGEADSQPEA